MKLSKPAIRAVLAFWIWAGLVVLWPPLFLILPVFLVSILVYAAVALITDQF